jgi:hypothetical protein
MEGHMCIFVRFNAILTQNFKAVFVGAEIFVHFARVLMAVLLDLELPVLTGLATGKHTHILSIINM